MNNSKDITQKLLETVERYTNGTMANDELIAFEKKLENQEFKAQVNDIKTLIFGIEQQALKEQLNTFHKNVSKTKTIAKELSKVRFLNFRKLVAAAAIIIAVGSVWFFNQSSNDKLYAKYFTPDPGLPTTMSTNENSNYEFYDAMVNYKHGDYKMAIDKWSVLQERKPDNDTLNYFLGVAHLANKNASDAIPFLKRSIETENDFIFLDDAYLYLGLAYLKEGNIELAKKSLSISNTDASKALISILTQ